MSTVFSEGAKKDLLDLVKRQGQLSVDEATDRLKLAKTTVRQHLLQLERQGLIQRESRRAHVGRPQLVFALSGAGQKLYPSQDPALLRALIEHLNANGHRDVVQSLFEQYWERRRQQFESILASLGPRKNETTARLEALETLLKTEGFMPEIERRHGKPISVRECNCPFPEAIRATKLPCKLESEFIDWALKIEFERTSYIPKGDSTCAYTQRGPENRAGNREKI